MCSCVTCEEVFAFFLVRLVRIPPDLQYLLSFQLQSFKKVSNVFLEQKMVTVEYFLPMSSNNAGNRPVNNLR